MKPSSELSFFIETLGCAKNVVDSRTMRSDLLKNGFEEKESPEEADFILINTCSFVKEAQESTIENIFEAIKLKSERSDKKVGIIGCFTQQFADTLKTEIPEADFFLGTRKYHEISSILSKDFDIKLQPVKPGERQKAIVSETNLPYAYFRIAQGCSRSCSFCIIPKLRGPLISYDLKQIDEQYQSEIQSREDIESLKEAILVSQDTISTPLEKIEEAVEFFNKKEHIKWIRLHYFFPDKRMFDVIDMMNRYEKVVPYLDIPFQHISPKILRLMNRPDDSSIFTKIINYAIEKNPATEIRTSFILGFPGETEEDVEEIAEFLRNNPVHKCSLFRYSHEEGTPSYSSFEDSVSEEDKSDRINYIRNTHLEHRLAPRNSLTGKTVKLILDDISEKEIIGRRPQDSPEIDEIVFLSGSKEGLKVGDIINARLDTAMEYDWLGEIV